MLIVVIIRILKLTSNQKLTINLPSCLFFHFEPKYINKTLENK